MEYAEAITLPSFLVVTARVGAEQHALRLERCTEIPHDPRQLLGRNMEERCVREDPVEHSLGQFELQKILLPHFATGGRTRHGHELRRAVQSDRAVTESRERGQIAPRAAAEVQDRER